MSKYKLNSTLFKKAMNIFQFKQIVFFTSILLLSSLIVLTGCARYELFVPEYRHFTPPPDEVTIEQLLSDYMTDQVAADAKYKGKTFLFTRIEVEEVGNNLTDHRANPASDIYIISGSARFTPKYISEFDYIAEGFVVDIIGECQGWQFSRVLITDCWVGVVEGDLSDLPSIEY